MSHLDAAAFQEEVLDRIREFSEQMPAALRTPFEAMLKRRGYLFVDDLPDYFNPMATPLLQLPIWMASKLRSEGASIPDESVVDAAEAALTGYFLIRVHDDFCDEQVGDPQVVLMLSTALHARMQVLFARVAPRGSRFWTLYEELFVAYGDAMLLEHRLHNESGVKDADSFDAVLRRSDLLLLAGAAIQAHADSWDSLDHFRSMVRSLVRAVQLFNDVFDAEDDQARGNFTYVVCRFGGDTDPGAMRKALLAEGGLDEIVDEAIACVEDAAAHAKQMELSEALGYMSARIEAMDRTRSDFFGSLLARILANVGTAESGPDSRPT